MYLPTAEKGEIKDKLANKLTGSLSKAATVSSCQNSFFPTWKNQMYLENTPL